LLTETLGWRAIFWLLVPLAAVSLLIGVKTIPETSDETVPRRLDLSGLTLIAAGIGLFTFAFDRAPSWGWLSAPTVGTFLASLVVLTTFVVVEKRVRLPLVNLSLLRNSRFSILVVAGTIANIAYTATVFLSTMNLQQVRGLDPLIAGVVFLGPSAGAALGGVDLGTSRIALLAHPGHGNGLHGRCGIAGRAGRFAAVGGVPHRADDVWFHHGPGLRVHNGRDADRRCARAGGRSRRRHLTALVTLAGVGIAVSGTVLEMLQRHGWNMADGIKSILAVIAALLVPAGLAVLRSTRGKAPAQEGSGF
jgi:hypothetical protein